MDSYQSGRIADALHALARAQSELAEATVTAAKIAANSQQQVVGKPSIYRIKS